MTFEIYLCVAILIYFCALVSVYLLQRKLMYYPDPVYVSPVAARASEELKELKVRTEDGLDLKAWYAPATSKPFTIIFFHGNGDRLRSVATIANPYIDAGYGFLLAEYRGYSGMPGSPTESGLYTDARSYVKALIASGIKETNLILF